MGLDPGSLLSVFNEAGVLAAADVHGALTLGRLGPDPAPLVGLGTALAVRAPRVGHVLVDLARVAATVVTGDDGRADEADLASLPWPAPGPWQAELGRSPLVAVGEETPEARPLRLVGSALYLDRYWRDERQVAAGLLAKAAARPLEVDEGWLGQQLESLFPSDPGGQQALAAATSARRLLSVIVGGPGTGKTTTVARVLALLDNQAALGKGAPPLVALAAPTGKAAARMAEAVHDEARRLGRATARATEERLLALGASTVHRLLGRTPASANRFRHNRQNRLPHDVVVVDETSMMSLPLMARLLEAVRPDARLVLLGDQEQLASVEAGAVLADIVGPGARLAYGSGPPVPAPQVPPGESGGAGEGWARAGPSESPMAPCINVLTKNYRFAGPLSDLAAAVRAGDADAVLEVLTAGASGGDGPVAWLGSDITPAPLTPTEPAALAPVRGKVTGAARLLVEAGEHGDARGALEALSQFRLLCAHRDGPWGASTWSSWAEAALARPGLIGLTEPEWYAGRPVLITENDYSLGLFNGDTGVTIRRADGGLGVAFWRGGSVFVVSPSRLSAVESAFALTAHRAQGSEFDDVVFVLPPPASRVLTRELFYTAVTRARRQVVVVGGEASVRAAMGRPVARASGLTARLWPGS